MEWRRTTTRVLMNCLALRVLSAPLYTRVIAWVHIALLLHIFTITLVINTLVGRKRCVHLWRKQRYGAGSASVRVPMLCACIQTLCSFFAKLSQECLFWSTNSEQLSMTALSATRPFELKMFCKDFLIIPALRTFCDDLFSRHFANNYFRGVILGARGVSAHILNNANFCTTCILST